MTQTSNYSDLSLYLGLFRGRSTAFEGRPWFIFEKHATLTIPKAKKEKSPPGAAPDAAYARPLIFPFVAFICLLKKLLKLGFGVGYLRIFQLQH